MARSPEGPPPPPAVQRVRFRYAKRGRLRFSSHRDFQRALERAVRRAQVPVAHSAGFNPRPRISYANAAPTGAASEAEYVEIALMSAVDPQWLRAALDEALPPGLDVVAAVEATPGSLADRLEASVWQVELAGTDPAQARAAVAGLLAVEEVMVQRLTKSGVRTFDARAAVVRIDVLDPSTADDPQVTALAEPGLRVAQASHSVCAILQMVLRHCTPAVRPDDVLAALRAQADLAPLSPPRMTRLAQGPLNAEDGTVADPLAAAPDVAGT